MANNHRIVVNPSTLPFSTYPIQIATTTPFVVNYVASSYGVAMRAVGNRIWDTSVLAPSGIVTVNPSTPLLFPFTTNNLPLNYFDAIFLLFINNDRYIQGFSNSPDNAASYSSNYLLEDKKIFTLNLNCFGLNNAYGNSDANNHYMFGGDSRQLGYAPALLTFATAPIIDLSMTLKVKLYDYIGTNYPIKIVNFVVPAGSLSFNLGNLRMDFFYGDLGIDPYQITGYLKCEVISSDPSFVSILPFYHWGQAG